MADTDLLFRIIAQDEAKQALAEARAEVDKMTEAEKSSVKAAHEAQESDKALAESKHQVIDATDKATESSNRWFKSLVDVKAGIDIAKGIAEPIMNVAKTAIQAASDLSETKNKIDTLFGSSSNAIQQWAAGAATSIGQSQKQALDAASTFGVFGKAAGLAGDDLAKFSQDNVKLASDMASFFNTSPDDAIQAIGAAFRGEQEPIRRYGVLIDEASLKNEAMKLGLISTTKDALQPQQRVLAAQALILQQTGAAQGDFAKTADGLANSQRIARAELENTMASIGERFLPIAQKGVSVVNGLLGAFNSLPEPMQNVVLALGGISLAAVPVISNYTEIKKVAEDVAKGWPKLTEAVRDFSSATKAIEFGIIIAGLIAIAKYLDEVGVAAKSTNEDLIAMSQSGDIFKQAGASTELLINGQERLNKVVREVGTGLKEEGKSYDAYRAGVLGAAVAAGTLTQAQADELIATGKVTDAWYRQIDVTQEIIQKTGLQSRAVYEAIEGWGGLEKVYKVTTEAGKQFLSIVAPQAAALLDAGNGADMAAQRYQAMGDAMVKANGLAEQSISVLKISMGGAVTKEMESFGNKQEDLEKKAAKVKEELDKLERSQGAVVSSTKKHGMTAAETALAQLQLSKAEAELNAESAKGTLSAEQLAAAQAKVAENKEKLSGATKKEIENNGQLRAASQALSEAQAQLASNTDPMKQAELAVKVENLKEKLGQATGAVVSYVDNSKKIAELKGEYADLNEEIAKNAEEHDKATKRILFDIAAQQLATIQDPQLRAKAMNELALQWGLVDKATYDATTSIIGYTDQLAKDKNLDAFKQNLQGVYRDIAAPPLDTEAAGKALEAQTQAAQKAREALRTKDKAEDIEIPQAKAGSVERAQQALDYENKNKQAKAETRAEQEKLSASEEKASREMKGRSEQVVGGYNAVGNAVEDTKKRTTDMNQQAIAEAQARSTADEKASREMKGRVDEIAESYKNIPAVVETEVKQKITIVTEVDKAKAVAGDSPEERRAQAQAQKNTTDIGSAAKKVSDDLATAGKTILETLGTLATGQSDKVKNAGNSITDSFKNTVTNILGLINDAANTANKDMGALVNQIIRAEGVHEVIFHVTTTGDDIPSASGANVPGRQHGGPIYTEGLYRLHADEYVLSAPMRYGQQPIPQQAIPAARGGDTTITTNNFYDAAAAKLWQEKQRLDRVQSVLEAM